MSDVEIGFLDFFQDLEDPRIDRKKLYSIEEIGSRPGTSPERSHGTVRETLASYGS